MTSEDRAEFLLAFAEVLFVNGRSTDRIISGVAVLGTTLGAHVLAMPRWGHIEIEVADREQTPLWSISASPTAIHMGRVHAAMRADAELRAGHLQPEVARQAILTASRLPPAPLSIFMLAGGGGAAAMALLSGLQDGIAAMVIFVSGGAGALLRRLLARLSANPLLQPFAAALLAGLIAALVARDHDPGPADFVVAVSACLILVPGPHILNGALDLIGGHIRLGVARLIHAALLLLAICSGLLLGLGLMGATLPAEADIAAVPLWQDAIAAGIAIAAYGTFFAMPPRMLAWPMAIGMLAHGLKWVVLTACGLSSVTGVFCACLLVGFLMTPLAHHTHLPFAAIGFSAVVSMMPGLLIIRIVNALASLYGADPSAGVIALAVSDGAEATLTILAMSLGLVLPRLLIENVVRARLRRKTHDNVQPREATR